MNSIRYISHSKLPDAQHFFFQSYSDFTAVLETMKNCLKLFINHDNEYKSYAYNYI